MTFLFTDLEGSTRLWEEFPDAMQDALARHDALVQDAVAAHDGYLVKTTGDGAHAAFATARAAIDAAIDAQLALTREAWGETGPLQVRMGLHTGVSELRDGDYYGTAVNRAARLDVGRARRSGRVLAGDRGSRRATTSTVRCSSPTSVSTGCATSARRNACSR